MASISLAFRAMGTLLPTTCLHFIFSLISSDYLLSTLKRSGTLFNVAFRTLFYFLQNFVLAWIRVIALVLRVPLIFVAFKAVSALLMDR